MCELWDLPQLNKQQLLELQHVGRKLRLPNTDAAQKQWLQTQIQHKQKAIAEHEAANKKHNIHQWQQNMKFDAAARYKWVNRGCNTTPLSQVTNKGQILTTDQLILDSIHEHWKTLWQAANPQGHQDQATLVLSHLPRGDALPERPTLKDFTKVKARLKGAAGPDHWTHQEISALPPDITSFLVQQNHGCLGTSTLHTYSLAALSSN